MQMPPSQIQTQSIQPTQQQPQLDQEQFKAQQQQQLMQQQQYLKQQAMMQMQHQQQMQQQQMHHQNPPQPNQSSKKLNKDTFENIKEKFSNSNFSNLLQELLILSVLFIVYNSDFSKLIISKIPGITLSNGKYNTLGTVISAIIFSLIFIIARFII